TTPTRPSTSRRSSCSTGRTGRTSGWPSRPAAGRCPSPLAPAPPPRRERSVSPGRTCTAPRDEPAARKAPAPGGPPPLPPFGDGGPPPLKPFGDGGAGGGPTVNTGWRRGHQAGGGAPGGGGGGGRGGVHGGRLLASGQRSGCRRASRAAHL